MRGLRGVFAGILALAALQRVLGPDNPGGPQAVPPPQTRVGALFLDVARLAQRALSADVPTFGPIPNSSSSTSTSGGGTAQLSPSGTGGGFTVTPLPSSVPTPQVAPGWRPAPPTQPATPITI